MARIRSIKPEFPQSESMGRVSRDARLLFVMLWPICDDHGRTRASSRMLASLLFPYDDDAKDLIDTWINELASEGCIGLYESEGSKYLVVRNWLKHQKIDKPSKPQFPEPPEEFASPREDSRAFVVGREGKGREGKEDMSPAVPETADCPHEEIVAMYHDLMPANPRIKIWTEDRRKALRARWREDPKRQSLEYWDRFFRHCANSEFLTGRTSDRDGRSFQPGLDWMVLPRNFIKIIEGKYHQGKAA